MINSIKLPKLETKLLSVPESIFLNFVIARTKFVIRINFEILCNPIANCLILFFKLFVAMLLFFVNGAIKFVAKN